MDVFAIPNVKKDTMQVDAVYAHQMVAQVYGKPLHKGKVVVVTKKESPNCVTLNVEMVIDL